MDTFFIDMSITESKFWNGDCWSDILLPEAIGKLRHLAIQDFEWEMLDPDAIALYLQEGIDDTESLLSILEFTAVQTSA
jgi:hypothetical protein